MKRFGEYLVTQGLITEADLVQVLLEQKALEPDPCKFVLSNNLINVTEVLKVLRYQDDRKADFFTACAQLGVSHDTALQKFLEEKKRVHRPLGEIILSKNLLTFDKVASALDSFLKEMGVYVVVPEPTQATAAPKKHLKLVTSNPPPEENLNVGGVYTLPYPPGIPDRAGVMRTIDLGEDPEFYEMDETLANEFVGVFNSTLFAELKTASASLMTGQDRPTYLSATLETLRLIREASQFVKASCIHALTEPLEYLFLLVKKRQGVIEEQKYLEMASLLDQVISQYEMLHESIRSQKSEKSYWSTQSQSFKLLVKRLNEAANQLDNAPQAAA